VSLPNPSEQSTALVTGASSGIGAEIARRLAARGHHLTLVARRVERLEELAGELGSDVAVDACDLGDAEARQGLVARLSRRRRKVSVLVNSAGFGTYGRLWELPAGRERDEVGLNVAALHDLTVAFLPGMVERRSGAILNVSSTAGFQPLPSNATYAATKAFVTAFSESLHGELAGTGVTCTVLCPGPVATEFQDAAGISHLHSAGPSFLWASAGEVATAAVEGMERGKRVVVPRATDKVQAAFGRYSPRSVLLPVMRGLGGRLFGN